MNFGDNKLPTNHQVGHDNILRDTYGKEVGKVNYSGHVYDRWHDKG